MNWSFFIRPGAAVLTLMLGAPVFANDNSCSGTFSLEQLDNRTDVFGDAVIDGSETESVVLFGCSGSSGVFSYDLGIR